MGTPVPPDFPNLDNNKWYCLSVDAYEENVPDTFCDGIFVARIKCCQTGAQIKAWYDRGAECKKGDGICAPGLNAPQRIVACHGPYNGGAECWADCEPEI